MTLPSDRSLEDGAFVESLLTELLKDAMDSRASEINTCLPAKITAVDHEKQTVDVVPSLVRLSKTTLDNLVEEPLPEFTSVPLSFPRGGNAVLYIPPQVGDYVLLVFPQYILSEWLRLGKDQNPVNPGDPRQHSLGSAVALAGVFPSGREVADLNASRAILGNPSGVGIGVESSQVVLGNLPGTAKKVARVGDTVRFAPNTINVSGPGGASTNASPCFGIIDSGSDTVKATD